MPPGHADPEDHHTEGSIMSRPPTTRELIAEGERVLSSLNGYMRACAMQGMQVKVYQQACKIPLMGPKTWPKAYFAMNVHIQDPEPISEDN